MQATRASDTSHAAQPVAPAIGDLFSHLRFWVVALAGLWLDLWSKHWVFTRLAAGEIRPFIPGAIDFRRSLNDGAVFGSFTGYTAVFILASLFALGFVFYLFAHSGRAQRSLHVALALILAGAFGNLYDRAFVVADVVRFTNTDGHQQSRIGLISDRSSEQVLWIGDYPDGANTQRFVRSDVTVRRQGVVRDFIKFVPEFPRWISSMAGRDIWPWVFNVADAALVCGVILLLLHTRFDRTSRQSRG